MPAHEYVCDACWLRQSGTTCCGRDMAFSAASFIYIALADLIPGHRRETSPKSVLWQFGLILGGIGSILLLHGVQE